MHVFEVQLVLGQWQFVNPNIAQQIELVVLLEIHGAALLVVVHEVDFALVDRVVNFAYVTSAFGRGLGRGSSGGVRVTGRLNLLRNENDLALVPILGLGLVRMSLGLQLSVVKFAGHGLVARGESAAIRVDRVGLDKVFGSRLGCS